MGRHVVVIGGGTAGMEAAGRLAREGVSVTLVEKGNELEDISGIGIICSPTGEAAMKSLNISEDWFRIRTYF